MSIRALVMLYSVQLTNKSLNQYPDYVLWNLKMEQ
jgi:hypothetical protein